jgi:hypothetical protein
MRYRHGAHFVLRPQDYYRPLDRNQRARLIQIAERIERASKAKGKRSGFLGLTGLQVLRALMFGCLGKDGRLDPSYAHLQRLTGFARATIAKALHALEALGLLRIVRRIVRRRIARLSPITGEPETIIATVQASSLYVLQEPSSASGQEPHQRFSVGSPSRGLRQALYLGTERFGRERSHGDQFGGRRSDQRLQGLYRGRQGLRNLG